MFGCFGEMTTYICRLQQYDDQISGHLQCELRYFASGDNKLVGTIQKCNECQRRRHWECIDDGLCDAFPDVRMEGLNSITMFHRPECLS